MLPNQSGYGSLAALIPDEFQIVDRLGYGRTGELFRVRNRRNNEEVVLKLTATQFAEHSPQHEATFQKTCSHENIVRIIKTYDCGTTFIMAMEYMPDGSLADLLARKFVPVAESIAYCVDFR